MMTVYDASSCELDTWVIALKQQAVIDGFFRMATVRGPLFMTNGQLPALVIGRNSLHSPSRSYVKRFLQKCDGMSEKVRVSLVL